MRLVILESPFAGSYVGPGQRLVRWVQRRANVRYARRCMHHALLHGDAPLASHLLYTQPGILDDDVPRERILGIDAGLMWGARAEATVVYTDRGTSRGMLFGIHAAEAAGRAIDFRSLGEDGGFDLLEDFLGIFFRRLRAT